MNVHDLSDAVSQTVAGALYNKELYVGCSMHEKEMSSAADRTLRMNAQTWH